MRAMWNILYPSIPWWLVIITLFLQMWKMRLRIDNLVEVTQEGHTLRAGLSEFYLVLSPCYNVTLFYCIIIKESN